MLATFYIRLIWGALMAGAGAIGTGYATAIVSGVLIGSGMVGLGSAMMEGVTDYHDGEGINWCAVKDGITSTRTLFSGVKMGVQGYRDIAESVERQTQEAIRNGFGVDGEGCNSFSADTTVQTSNGDIPISEIEIGDTVIAYDEETGITGEYTVTDTISHEDDAIAYVTINGEEIETTPWHLFYTST